jgi:4-hydroxy-3-methylbut-2-en-1-yl diphosphate reductase
MQVNLDPYAGVCSGVKRAIEVAELQLNKHENLFCLGEIVHNEDELRRLEKSGLQTIKLDEIDNLNESIILIRAHGEPPSTYKKAREKKLGIIDATCPVVLKLQKKIRNYSLEMLKENGQVVIIGSKNHPEIISLAGQAEKNAIILESSRDIDKINFDKPVRLFIQTTRNISELEEVVSGISQGYKNKGVENPDFKYFNTVCGHVSGRIPSLKKFCSQNQVIIFVSGKNSSNGNQLFRICQSVNTKSHFISSATEIKKEWFIDATSVGISGSTSTPLWQMEEIAHFISTL